jgi:predicted ribosome quality control (RQC) complex YloA/Tae2 family protein
MDANKIKFVDDDGTVEVLEPPMTARIHVETPSRPEEPDLEGIQEEESKDHLLKDEVVEIISSSAEEQVNETVKNEVEEVASSAEEVASSVEEAACSVEEVASSVEEVASSVEEAASSVEEAVEQHVKEIEYNVLLAASQGAPHVIEMDEVKVPYNEALSLLANTHASEHKPITPKGCCILQ